MRKFSSKISRGGFGGQGFMLWPAIFNSSGDRTSVQPKAFAPFGFGHTDSVKCKNPIVAFVILLLCSSSPTAVFFRIIRVIVDAIKLMCGRWSFPHVSNECLKRLPIFANFNSPSTVSCKATGFRILASSFHASPNIKFRRVCHAVCEAIFISKFHNRSISISV